MKLLNTYTYKKVIRLWKRHGSKSQKKAAKILTKLDLQNIINSELIVLGGLISIGDGSIRNEVEIQFLCNKNDGILDSFSELINKLVLNIKTEFTACLYKNSVEIIFPYEDFNISIRIFGNKKDMKGPKVWWVRNYFFKEILLHPSRIKILQDYLNLGIATSLAFSLTLEDLKERSILNKFQNNYYETDEALKIIRLNKNAYGYEKIERGIIIWF